jgi:hypothetical protein
VSPPPSQCKSLDGNIYAEAGRPTPSAMGNSAAELLGLFCAVCICKVCWISQSPWRSSCYQRADNQDSQQTQDDRPNDEGRDH